MNKLIIEDKLIAVKIKMIGNQIMSRKNLYNNTRGVWRLSIENVINYEYVLSIYDKAVKEVYKVNKWYEAKEGVINPVEGIPITKEDMIDWAEGRVLFEGEVAPDEIRDKYIYKDASKLFTKNTDNEGSNPAMYFD